MKIIPTVLAFDKITFDKRFKKIVPITDEIQVDFMDGRFVKTKSITEQQAPSVKQYKNKIFEAHLMVKEPLRWVPILVDKGFKRIILHVETVWQEDISSLKKFMDREGVEFFLAINPETPLEKILPHTTYLDGVLFLGVHPGQNNAPYLTSTPARIKEFVRKNKNKKLIIQVDGGMTPVTVQGVIDAGATRINAGHFIMNAQDPKKALEAITAAAEEA